MKEERIFDALRAFVGTVIGDEPVSGVVSQPRTDALYVRRYVVTIVPHASVAPHAIDQVRNREADCVREAIADDPTLGGRLPDAGGKFVGVERTATVGELAVAYLI